MNCLVFNVKGFKFGVSIDSIERIVETGGKIYPLPMVPDFVTGIMNFRGRVITAIDLGLFLRVTSVKSFELMVISNRLKHIGYTIPNTQGFVKIDDNMLEDVEKFSIEKERKEYIKHIAQDADGEIISILDIDRVEDFIKKPKNWSNYYEE